MNFLDIGGMMNANKKEPRHPIPLVVSSTKVNGFMGLNKAVGTQTTSNYLTKLKDKGVISSPAFSL